MADRNPSKQRRQAENRAAREARKARAEAANTPVTERRVVDTATDVEDQAGQRKRSKRKATELNKRAREVIARTDGGDEDLDFEVVDEADDFVTAVPDSPARRGASPIFSSKHRAEVARATAGAAPARTHAGVGAAIGLAASPAPRRSMATTRSTVQGGRGTGKAATTDSKAPAKGREGGSTRATSTRGAAVRSNTGSQRANPTRKVERRPQKQLPAWLDRFGANDPGGQWVMLSFVGVLLASVAVNFVHIVPEYAKTSKGKQVRTGHMFTIWHFGVGPGLYFLLPPIVILGLFILTARPSNRRRSWGIALMCLIFITYVTGSIAIYVIPIACLGWGWWSARRAALDEVGGDPRLLKEVDRERRLAERDAMRHRRDKS